MKPALVIIDMQHYFFRSEERRVKLSELITSINEKSGRTPRFTETKKQLQAADNKGSTLFGRQALALGTGLSGAYEISFLRCLAAARSCQRPENPKRALLSGVSCTIRLALRTLNTAVRTG